MQTVTELQRSDRFSDPHEEWVCQVWQEMLGSKSPPSLIEIFANKYLSIEYIMYDNISNIIYILYI